MGGKVLQGRYEKEMPCMLQNNKVLGKALLARCGARDNKSVKGLQSLGWLLNTQEEDSRDGAVL